MTRTELIDDVLRHSANGRYNNETDSYNELIYYRIDLVKMSNEQIINVYCDFCAMTKGEKKDFINDELNLDTM